MKNASYSESIDVKKDVDALLEGEDFSDEFKTKAETIFEAAVSSRISEVKETLEEQKTQAIEEAKEDMVDKIDSYLTYVTEEWKKENELAIARGLRSEMTENFIEGLKTLFVEHYVDVPEDKYDVIDELANRLDEMEQKLDGEVTRNMEVTEELETLKRGNIVKSAGEDLTESQREKLESLAEGVDYKNEEDFAEKISEVKNAYFPVDGESLEEETIVEEGTGTLTEESDSEEKILDPNMNVYSSAISKLKPLG